MNLSISHILQLMLFSVLLSCGQMLFKVVASALPAFNSVSWFLTLAVNPWFYLAVLLYGAATLLWISILQHVPLSLAYPFVALGFVIVPLASWVLFKEPLNISYALGVVFIIIGLGMIAIWGAK